MFRSTAVVVMALSLSAMDLAAQDKLALTDSTTLREQSVKRARRAAGLRTGSWQVSGVRGTPAFEGYLQRGFDRHLVLESSAGFWYRSQPNGTGGRNNAYVIPMMTSLKLYPMTGPEAQLEPFVSAGVGFTMGIDDRDGGTSLAGATAGGTAIILGLGAKGGAGIEYRIGSTFGLQAGAGYQYIRFLEEMGGQRTYRGVQGFGGVTYRFQF